MCNLAGYSGVTDASPQILKLLMIYGRRRGTDGVGIIMNKKMYKYCGHDKGVNTSDALELIFGTTIQNTGNVVLTHNRARSRGVVSLSNTHPFIYDYIEGKKWAFAHNGTITNIYQLSNKYNAGHTADKTDSETLGKIIYEHGFEVLTEYEGCAAFSLYDITNNILYLWKGASKHDSNIISEERPLHYWSNKNKTKLYYASEKNALVTAINTTDNIYDVPSNTLLKIENGKIVEKTEYNRSAIEYINYTSYVDSYNDSYYNRNKTSYNNYPPKKDSGGETSPQNEARGRVYFFSNLYWHNGHKMDGIYEIDVNLYPKKIGNSQYKVEDEDSYVCFSKGYMLKDILTYVNCLTDNFDFEELTAEELVAMLHPDAIYAVKNPTWSMYTDGEKVAPNTEVRPAYSDRFYYIKDGQFYFREVATENKHFTAIPSKTTSINTVDNAENFQESREY